eukprot:TRINITY_DN12670_c0_g1_i1.p1 TRINITY_DN12670_c0_g1~~TRINITY_DN12670_c0_g1_i1.p1  ORF type:complete len:246 (-),score=33.51 TRINITY_DN12670_c0_g1_i1:631-1368(-)
MLFPPEINGSELKKSVMWFIDFGGLIASTITEEHHAFTTAVAASQIVEPSMIKKQNDGENKIVIESQVVEGQSNERVAKRRKGEDGKPVVEESFQTESVQNNTTTSNLSQRAEKSVSLDHVTHVLEAAYWQYLKLLLFGNTVNPKVLNLGALRLVALNSICKNFLLYRTKFQTPEQFHTFESTAFRIYFSYLNQTSELNKVTIDFFWAASSLSITTRCGGFLDQAAKWILVNKARNVIRSLSQYF